MLKKRKLKKMHNKDDFFMQNCKEAELAHEITHINTVGNSIGLPFGIFLYNKSTGVIYDEENDTLIGVKNLSSLLSNKIKLMCNITEFNKRVDDATLVGVDKMELLAAKPKPKRKKGLLKFRF